MTDSDRWYVIPIGDGEMSAFKVIRSYGKKDLDGYTYRAVRIKRDGHIVEWEYEPERGEMIVTFAELVALQLKGKVKVNLRNEP